MLHEVQNSSPSKRPQVATILATDNEHRVQHAAGEWFFPAYYFHVRNHKPVTHTTRFAGPILDFFKKGCRHIIGE